MLSLYVNTSVIHDVSIFSEVFIGLLGDLSFTKRNDLLEWIFSDTSSPLIGDVDIDDDFNSESIITTESKKLHCYWSRSKSDSTRRRKESI